MPEITLKARIQNKYESLEEWGRIGKGQFIPLKGEVCYAVDNGLVYQKVGDGTTDFTELPWLLNQGDNTVNDENSPAYIKNRLAYEYYKDINSDLQTLLSQNNFTAEIFTEESLGVTLNINFESIVNAVGEFELTATQVKNINSNGVYQFILNNNTTSYQFDIKNLIPSLFNDTLVSSNTAYYCYGNSYIANLILGEDVDVFDPTINSTENYSIVFIYQWEEEEGYLQIIFVGNADVYIPIATTTDSETTYSFLGDMFYLQTLSTKTIDEKFLGNIKANQDQVDSSQLSYIRNHYGPHGELEYDNTQITEYYATTFTLSSAIFGFNGVSSETPTNFLSEEYFHIFKNFQITIDSEVYDYCPIFQIQAVNNGENFYYIGNPKYLSSFWNQIISAGISSEDAEYIDFKIANFEDNGFPFIFELDVSSATPIYSANFVKIEGYSKGDTASISIKPQTLNIMSRAIPKYLLPEDQKVGELDESKNSILFNSAYSATGANSIAAGIGTNATAAQAVAVGSGTTANGANSLAGGSGTVASGANSLAGGSGTVASGAHSVALGANSKATGQSAFAFGESIITGSYICTRPSITQAIFTAYSDISECGYTECSFDGGTTWLTISKVTFSDNQCTISFTPSVDDLTKTSIQLRKSTIASGADATALGKGNVSAHASSLVIGTGNTSGADNQTVIGKYNEIDSEAAFIIGNGGIKLDSGMATAYHNQSRSNAMVVDWEGNVSASGDLIGKSLSFNSELSVLGTDKYLDLSTTKTNELTVQIQSTSSTDTDLSIYQGEIHNKNWWPLTGWDLATDSKGTGTVLDDGSYQLTYTNGSVIVFNIDGSINLDYVEGDTLSITLSSSKSSCHLPAGNFILSNGIDANCGIKLYAKSTSNETEDGTLPGISPVCQLKGKTTLGVRTVSGTTSFSTTFYPQLEMVDEESVNRTAYVAPQIDRFYFNTDGTYTINVTKYLSQWEKPSFIFPDNSTIRTIKGYYFNDMNKIPYIDSIISEGRKEKRYIIDLKNLGDYGTFVVDTNGDNASFALTIKLGVKNNNTGSWIPYSNNITSEQLAIIDLYGDALENSLGEYLSGYKLSNGYLINTSDIWSISAEDFKDLLTNSLDAQFESGSVRLRKNIIDNVEYCELYYNMYFYSASDEIKEIFNMLAMADKFITFLPEGYENIYVN